MKSLIKKLVEAYGPSGLEDGIREIIKSEISERTEVLEISPMGSLHAVINQDGHPKVMLAAHMDEIGIIISHIDKKGYARFQQIGGVDLRTLLGHRVRFPGDIVGVFGIDLERGTDKPPRIGDYFIDFGASDRDGCPVSVGDIGAFDRPFLDLGGRIVAKSLDDRIGVAILIELMRRIDRTPYEVQFAFTVQEEVGCRGATTSAFGLNPDLGIAVDVTETGDTPRGIKMAVALGQGPAIKVRDERMLSDPRLVRFIADVAEQAGIAYQMEVLQDGGTDAASIQLSRAGVPAGCISIPARYIHTPSEMVDYGDVEDTVRLLVEILKRPIEILQAEQH